MEDNTPDRVTVEILGKRYTFACEGEAEAARVREAAELVEERMRRIRDEQHPPSPLQTAILAALNLVDEMRRMRSEYEAAETDIAERTNRLTASLGKLLEPAEQPPVPTPAAGNRVFTSLATDATSGKSPS